VTWSPPSWIVVGRLLGHPGQVPGRRLLQPRGSGGGAGDRSADDLQHGVYAAGAGVSASHLRIASAVSSLYANTQLT
jgi:hypothetical protein